jgi:hypothetical protein
MLSSINRIRISVWGTILILAILSLIYTGKREEKSRKQMITGIDLLTVKALEKGYALGQADALNAIINIRKVNDSIYVWTGSPWNRTKPPTDTIKYIK